MTLKRCVISGIGHRSKSWISEIVTKYSDCVKLVGLCDPFTERAEDAKKLFSFQANVYADFDTMLATEKPDLTIITSPDHVHSEQIVKALLSGSAVASEKPLCLTPEEAEAILEAEQKSRQKLFMGFNYRHIPLCSKIREVLQNGEIGRPVSMNLTWYLDYKGHGASYFRRWHRLMKQSGGLLITKAAHHFDLANWFFDDYPQKVYALCRRNFFGTAGGKMEAKTCRTCTKKQNCKFFFDIEDIERRSKELNYEAGRVRDYDGDYCVFSEDADIYDTMALLVQYQNGGILTYTLDASVPFEGWNLTINGTQGRLETGITDNKPLPGWQNHFQIVDPQGKLIKDLGGRITSWPSEYTIHVMPHNSSDHLYKVPNLADGHGGGDQRIFEALFRGYDKTGDPLHTFANALDGMASMMIGWAANRSAETGEPVELHQLKKWLH